MTELVWDGKYGEDGRRVAPVRVALPFQAVETVNESARERQLALDFFAQGRDTAWRNRLIWGDKKYVLPSLLPDFAGKVDLVYIDPPFDTGADFSFTTRIPDSDASFTKEPSIIEQKAYRDTWGRGLDSYLQWFYETVVLLHEMLSESGSIYVHLDWHVGHYAKVILDEVFGYGAVESQNAKGFRNEIVWGYSGGGIPQRELPRKHDVIFWYSKGTEWTFNTQYRPYSPGTVQRGRTAIKGLDAKLREEGTPINDWWPDVKKITSPTDPEKLYYDTQKSEELLTRIISMASNPHDLVLDCFCGSGTAAAVAEKLGRRWITCDLGRFAIQTTRKRLLAIDNVRPFVVQNLGKYERQAWQVAEFPSSTDTPPGEPRAAMQHAARQAAYRCFILDLYHAEPLTGYTWLHGLKNGRFVHVGPVDAPVTAEDAKAVARECWRAAGRGNRPAPDGDDTTGAGWKPAVQGGYDEGRLEAGGPRGYDEGRLEAGGPRGYEDGGQVAGDVSNAADVLGWDFAFEVNETAKAIAAEANVRLSFKRIPREVLEKKAVEQGDIRFFELAALSLDVRRDKRAVTVALTGFMMPPDDVPADVQAAITNWSQWIDYWAVDWDYRDDTFHNQWQSYRTRKDPTLQCSVAHTYDEPGCYIIVVKVIDILGNDTTKSVTVDVP